jgi:FAD-dependent oxidoreductase family protein
MKRRDFFRTSALFGASLSGATPAPVGAWPEPARNTPIAADADVVVCGAGPAGVSAAISAARTGARTRLIEVHGCLGGVWTAGLLSNIIDSENKTGLMPEILSRLRQTGTQIDAFRYDSECMKRLLETMCSQAGVKVLLHTRVVAAYKDASNRLTTVVTENKSGRQAWQAKTFVDATGDGDLAARAGCHFDLGHPITGKMQPMTLMALLMGVDYQALHARRLMRGDGISSATAPPKGISAEESKQNFVIELRRAGIEPSYLGPTLFPVRNNLIALMVNHEYGYSALDAQQVTDATLHARQEVNQVVDALRNLGGVWKDVRLVATGEQIGTREGRRIRGRYVITKDDLISGARFPDAVCRITSGVDIHALDPTTNKKTSSEGIRTKPYDIPLRALIAADVDGLLMAGRCISGDFFAHASYRMTGNAVPMGEAAGKVAATAAVKGCLPQDVDWRG